MGELLKSYAFQVGMLFCLAGTGFAINFWLRSRPIEIPVILVLAIGLLLMFIGWRSAHQKKK